MNNPFDMERRSGMKALAGYENLTIRISRQRIFKPNYNNGTGYMFFVKSDEIPGCSAHGSTISEALNNFQENAEVWLRWFANSF